MRGLQLADWCRQSKKVLVCNTTTKDKYCFFLSYISVVQSATTSIQEFSTIHAFHIHCPASAGIFEAGDHVSKPGSLWLFIHRLAFLQLQLLPPAPPSATFFHHHHNSQQACASLERPLSRRLAHLLLLFSEIARPPTSYASLPTTSDVSSPTTHTRIRRNGRRTDSYSYSGRDYCAHVEHE